MATLADTFLRDLEELSDVEEENAELAKEEEKENQQNNSETLIPEKRLSKLCHNEAFKKFLTQIQESEQNCNSNSLFSAFKALSLVEIEDLEEDVILVYGLIVKANKYVIGIESEIEILHKKVRDIYIIKFPELESLVISPIDYIRTVKEIKNETDLTQVDLTSILPNHTIMTVTVSSSISNGKPLKKHLLDFTLELCDNILYLEECKAIIIKFLQNRMSLIGPNLTQLLGSSIAAKLMGAAGGIQELSKIPACNIQVLGAEKRELMGFSTASSQLHRGYLKESELVKNVESSIQIKVIRMLSTKAALAARIDTFKTSPNGSEGLRLRKEIVERIHKIETPQMAKLKKALPKPDDKPRRKRGGKRFSNLRKKAEMTEYRKYANRIKFGAEAQQEYRSTGKTFGMLGVGGTGKLKTPAIRNQKILKKVKTSALQKDNPSG